MTVEFNPEAIMGPIQEAFAPAVLATTRKAIELAPSQTGALRRSIHPMFGGPMEASISANVPYAAAVEEGTSAHTIAPIRKKALAGKGFGPVAGSVNHPATTGSHYLAEAAATFIETYKAELAKRLA